MTDYENLCVGCDTCMNCGLKHAQVKVCDECKRELDDTSYRRAQEPFGEELCEACAAGYADEIFEDMTLSDKLNMFNTDMSEYNTVIGAEVAMSELWYDLSDANKVEKMMDYGEILYSWCK